MWNDVSFAAGLPGGPVLQFGGFQGYKYGFMHSIIDVDYLLASSDRKLFINMQNCEHCLNHLPPYKNIDIVLRPVGHEFLLPTCKHSFIVRCFFSFVTD